MTKKNTSKFSSCFSFILNNFLLNQYSKLTVVNFQITTHSKLLATTDIEILCRFIPIQRQNVTLLTLQSLNSEHQFSSKIGYELLLKIDLFLNKGDNNFEFGLFKYMLHNSTLYIDLVPLLIKIFECVKHGITFKFIIATRKCSFLVIFF